MTNYKIFGNASRKISKHYNGRALCPDLLKALWLQHIPAEENTDDILCVVYKMIDRTNDWEYVGNFKATTYAKFATYCGSGTFLRHQIAQKGIQNFEFHFIGFFSNKKDAEELENKLVNENYIKNAKTYNLITGGSSENNWKGTRKAFYCPKTERTFVAHPDAADKIIKEFGYIEGQSPTTIEKTKRTAKNIAKHKAMKTIKLFKDDGKGNIDYISAQSDFVQNYIPLGWQFVSTRVWMHKPTKNNKYTRGVNWIQPGTHNIDYLQAKVAEGFIFGRPPRYEVAIKTSKGNRYKNSVKQDAS